MRFVLSIQVRWACGFGMRAKTWWSRRLTDNLCTATVSQVEALQSPQFLHIGMRIGSCKSHSLSSLPEEFECLLVYYFLFHFLSVDKDAESNMKVYQGLPTHSSSSIGSLDHLHSFWLRLANPAFFCARNSCSSWSTPLARNWRSLGRSWMMTAATSCRRTNGSKQWSG